MTMRFRNEINENNFKMCRDGCETGILAEKTRNKNSVFACIMCETAHCPKCLEKSHVGNCDNRILLDLITANNYCFCTKCKKAVFKDGGCNFMRCTCKYSFCDVCWAISKPWLATHLCLIKLTTKTKNYCTVTERIALTNIIINWNKINILGIFLL